MRQAARQLSRDDLKLLMDAKEKPEEGVEGGLECLPLFTLKRQVEAACLGTGV